VPFGGGLGLGMGLGVGLGRCGVRRSGGYRFGVLRAKVAPTIALALASKEHSSVFSMKARRRLAYLEEAMSGRV
jgi:hypothetical protein